MKEKIKIACLLAVFLIVLITVYSSGNFIVPHFSDFFYPRVDSIPESTINYDSFNDVSGMFNERGYYRSSSFTTDENEIINDFNGNLIYQLPLYSFKSDGDLKFEVSICYNGSVNHQIFLGDTNSYKNGTNSRHNINSPEWIISLNGIAVQILNFETHFFSKDISDNQISGNKLNALIQGYHFSSRLTPSDGLIDPDRINIMAGDGSLITLINKSSINSYTGTYVSESKNEHFKAKVTFIETEGHEAYRTRRVELMKGDGVVYVFEEIKTRFTDFNVSESIVNVHRKPKTLLLKEIRDQFGNKIFLGYNSVPIGMGDYPYGRPLLSSISSTVASIGLIYGTGGLKFEHNSELNGSYFMNFYEPVNYGQGTDYNHRAFVKKIRNPNLEEAFVSYENYVRKYTDVPNPFQSGNLTMNFSNLKRMRWYKNFNGASRGYSYTGNNTIEISLNIPANTFLKSNSYYGYGRDAFYVNMLSEKRDTNEVPKSKETFTYLYDCSRENCETDAVDSSDYYQSLKVIESLDGSTVNSSASIIKHERIYRVYPLPATLLPEQEKPDLGGIIKPVIEKVLNSSEEVVHQSSYSYVTGGVHISVGFTGSFLVKEMNDKIQNSPLRIWKYEYNYAGGNSAYDSVVIFKREIDPLGNYTETSLDTFFTLIRDFYGVPMSYYKYGDIKKIERFRAGAFKLESGEFVYIHDTSDSKGYYGQLRKEILYSSINFSTGIETSYEYYKRDTTGKALWQSLGSGEMPKIEGNLKLIKYPCSQEEKYFYFPVSYSENAFDPPGIPDVPVLPKVSYKISYSNGTIQNLSEYVSDTRLPSRIDRYRRVNENYADTLGRIYVTYNKGGMPVKIINENRYLTLLNYRSVHRVSSITLPGDFSQNPDDTIIYITPNVFEDSLTFVSDGWGYYDANIGKTRLLENYYLDIPSCKDGFRMNKNSGNNKNEDAFIGFNHSVIPKFNSVSNAVLKISPLVFTHSVNGSNNPDLIENRVRVASNLEYAFNTTNCGNAIMKEYYPTFENSYVTTSITAPYNTNCQYNDNYINVTSLVQGLFSAGKKLYGMTVSTVLNPSIPPNGPFNYAFYLNFTNCDNFNSYIWFQNYSPRITIHGTIDMSDTLRIINPASATYYYEYNDDENTITVKSRLSSSPLIYKKLKYHIDGFGNIKRKDLYKTEIEYDSYYYRFNFLNMNSESEDALGNKTKFSYDELQRLTRKDNPPISGSTSHTLNGYSYQNVLAGYMNEGNYNGFVEKQSFTDETGREFNKYFDAIGNLLREEKFVAGDGNGNPAIEDNPFDPDTTYEGQDYPPQWIALTTDYKYDNLYRLIKVKTPEGKYIEYWYDSYGRQSQRRTPDAGYTKYSYDNNNNLIFSQDENQRFIFPNLYTRRTYDGLNRLLTLGDVKFSAPVIETGPMGDTLLPPEPDYMPSDDSLYVINVYDTISSAVSGIFLLNLPSDYHTSLSNNTRGNIVATAYRTRLSDPWNFKFFRYDSRSRVVKFWHYITGIGWKTEQYFYNSQNQVTRTLYQSGNPDGRLISYVYDRAGRLTETNLYVAQEIPSFENEEDIEYALSQPGSLLRLTKYEYNANSQVMKHYLNSDQFYTTYFYNSRGWINSTINNIQPWIFRYVLLYNPNGNIRKLILQGSYRNEFYRCNKKDDLWFTYIYDNSNRLLKSDRDSGTTGNTHDLINGYDKDGNLKMLKRYGSDNNLVDNFSYEYFSGTNRLKKLNPFQAGDDFSYDGNGNVTKDEISFNYDIKYDYRNLPVQMRNERVSDYTLWIRYWYDESGNRVRKLVIKSSLPDNTEPDWETPQAGMEVMSDEYYIRDVSGKEIAIYSGRSIQQWNFWGLDMIGHMNSDTTKYYYLKDHLGSVRVVINSQNDIVSARDYDSWGYVLECRSTGTSEMRYQFTGKEREWESDGYYYYGARYYNSLIGRWLSMEPLLEKYYSFTPYAYSVLNPLVFRDVNGKDAIAEIDTKNKTIKLKLQLNYSLYSEKNKEGLMERQIEFLKHLKNEAEELWSGNVEFNGENYTLNVEVILKEFVSFNEVINETKAGENFVKNASSEDKLGDLGLGVGGAGLFIRKDFSTRKFSASHEVGHLFGLPDRGQLDKSIMGYHPDRVGPKASDRQEIFHRANLDIAIKEPQRIRGYK